jgi:vesicle-fusing ATPase
MGSAAILELTLMPKQWQNLPTVFDKNVILGGACSDMTIDIAGVAGEGMTLSHSTSGWSPSIFQLLLDTEVRNDVEDEASSSGSLFLSLKGKERKDAIAAHFQSSVGGLQPQIDSIVRRVLDGRSIYSTHAEDGTSRTAINRSRLEAKDLLLLGLQPVRGLLLYGRPGVGKTLIVREIASLLSSRPPKMVAASELLDRWVGGSERLVRELFHDAEQELEMCRLAAVAGEEDSAFLNSALHVIVIDEIDAVFRKRSDSNDSGFNARNSVVNQLLAKLDGVNALPNILMIGTTNRRELLDPALLRPGRLEVQIEIPLPERSQRREILQIHFGELRKKNRLSFPLCCAIDGVASSCDDGDMVGGAEATSGCFHALKRATGIRLDFISTKRTVYDLADKTEGFSGADIEGLVRCAGSRALSRARNDGGGFGSLIITLDDVKEAIEEVKH